MPRFQSRLHPTKLAGGCAVAALAATLAFCLLAFVSGCVEETGGPADPGDDECQIKAEGEKSPGYPYDLAEYGEGALGRIALDRALAIGVVTDILFPLQQQEEVAQGLREGGTEADFLPLPSPQGHDAFLVDIARFGPAVRNFLSGL